MPDPVLVNPRDSPAIAGKRDKTAARASYSPRTTSLCEPLWAASRMAPMQHYRGSTTQQHTRGQAGRHAMIMPQQA
jgi:hypothetical protein